MHQSSIGYLGLLKTLLIRRVLLVYIASAICIIEVDEDIFIDHFIEESIFSDPESVIVRITDIWPRIDSSWMVWIGSDLWHLLGKTFSDITMLVEELIDFFGECELIHIIGIYELYLPSSLPPLSRAPLGQ
jgi:hypothetical protein